MSSIMLLLAIRAQTVVARLVPFAGMTELGWSRARSVSLFLPLLSSTSQRPSSSIAIVLFVCYIAVLPWLF